MLTATSNCLIDSCRTLVVLVILGFPARASAEDMPARFADLKPGMTADEVAKRLRHQKPDRVVRQIIYRRHLEQWYYIGENITLEFSCIPSAEPRLQSVTQGEVRKGR